MVLFSQRGWREVPYGNASVAENGCGVCVAASLVGITPKAVVAVWQDNYWDDDLGTLPIAFDMLEHDFGVTCARVEDVAVLNDGDCCVLLLEDDGILHYVMLIKRCDCVELYDPRDDSLSGLPRLSIEEAVSYIEGARDIWMCK